TLAEQIEAGSLILLWTHQELDGAIDEDNFVMGGLLGEFAEGTDFTSAAAGTGSFNVDPAAFKPGTGEPLIVFNPATMDDDGSRCAATANFSDAADGRLCSSTPTFNLSIPL